MGKVVGLEEAAFRKLGGKAREKERPWGSQEAIRSLAAAGNK